MRGYQSALLDPTEVTVVIIDHQPQMYFGVQSQDRRCILRNVVGLAKAAQVFSIPCILTTVESRSFSGNLVAKVQEVYPNITPIDRTLINCWEDANLKKAVEGTGRKKLVLAGLWTEVCVAFPALCAMQDGYEVYVCTDACGGATREAHDMAVMRMNQAGAKMVTWLQVLLEWQRDWADKTTRDAVMSIIKDYSGAYGLGVEYSETMTLPAPKQ